MADEKAKIEGSDSKKDKSFFRKREPKQPQTTEPIVMVDAPAKSLVDPSPNLGASKSEDEPKTMLDGNPVMKRKHEHVVQQRNVGAKKYFRSK